MATYAVGDIQGCFAPLQNLLQQVGFDPHKDCLWVAGDLVNRGPDNLNCLRFIRGLGDAARVVLGNHDLHLLAVAYGPKTPNPKDTLEDVLEAEDKHELLDWLRRQPLLQHHTGLGYVMTHAGIPPIWTLAEAKARAGEVEAVLCSDDYGEFFFHMYGNEPDQWSEALTGWDRLRVITNYLTRMRFCTADGRLDLKAKEGPNTAPAGFAPWFSHAGHRCTAKILFGHWAALEGRTSTHNAIALDTGCVWGNALTMMRLDDGKMFSTSCARR